MARNRHATPPPRPLPSAGLALLSAFLIVTGGWGVLFSENVASGLAKALSADGLSPPILRTLTLVVAFVGMSSLISGFATWFYSAHISSYVARTRAQLKQSTRTLWESFTAWVNACPREAVFLMLLTVIGSTLRARHLADPIRGDEAFSFLHFAAHGPAYVLSHYHTNSHTLHTFLVWLSTSLFGASEPAVRLPSFIASVLSIPTFYLLARRLAFPAIAMAATVLFTGHSWIVEFGTLSRGYSLQVLLVIMLALVFQRAHTLQKPVQPLRVALITCALFFTVLTSLYPVALLWSWHIWTCFRQQQCSRQNLKIFAVALSLSLALGLLLFTPILIVSKVASITGNYYVQPLTWPNFIERMGPALANLFTFTHYGWPRGVAVFSCLLALIAVWPDKTTRRNAPSPLLMIPVILALLCLQRVIPYTRIWIWITPFYLLLLAIGSWRIIRPATHFLRPTFYSPALALLFAILTPFLSLLPYNASLIRSSMEGSPNRDDPHITTWLASHLKPGDRVLTDTIYVRLHYYFTRFHLDVSSLGAPPTTDSQTIYVVHIPNGSLDRITSIHPIHHPEWSTPQTAATFPHGSRIDILRRISTQRPNSPKIEP